MVIKMSDKGTTSLITKGMMALLLFWLLTILIYLVFRTVFGYKEIFEGMNNTNFFLVLIISSIIILSVILLLIGKIMQKSIEIEIKEKELVASVGIIWPRELTTPYSELKEARLLYAPLQFIDEMFGVNDIIIEGKRIITVNGVENASNIVREINDRIAAAKKKKLTIEDLMKEVQELKDEIKALKAKKREEKPRIGEKKEEKRRGFEVSPLKEEI